MEEIFLIPGSFTEWGNDLGTRGVGGRMQSLRTCEDHKKNCGGKFFNFLAVLPNGEMI